LSKIKREIILLIILVIILFVTKESAINNGLEAVYYGFVGGWFVRSLWIAIQWFKQNRNIIKAK